MSNDVVVPAGRPLVEAAGWVGTACWSELALHGAITEVLVRESRAELRVALWEVRAHRAGQAERWHRLLPELREMPRESFVAPPIDEVERESAIVDSGGIASAISDLLDGYENHRGVANGPADGPVAAELGRAITLLRSDLALLARAEPSDQVSRTRT